MSENILEIQNLNISFQTEKNTFEAVKNLNLRLKKGEVLGIVGESGSGKSLSCMSILRLIQSRSAHITSDVFRYYSSDGSPKELYDLGIDDLEGIRGKSISMIFQEPMTSLNPVIRCGEQVAEALRKHEGLTTEEARKRTLELFEKVRLPQPDELYSRYPHEVSGGQKQRVMIAMAISCSPRILIADEPTTALDVSVQASILDLLRDLQKDLGMAIIFITHDLAVISSLADRIMVMYKGEIVESGNTQQIFESPQHPYTRGLLHCRPEPGIKTYPLPGLEDFLKDDASSLSQLPFPSRVAMDITQEEQPILEVQNLNKTFVNGGGWLGTNKKNTVAVNNVSFKVFKGETLGLVGESGCGKTTLGRIILRLIEADSGLIKYKGADITSLKGSELRRLRQKIQIIFQDPYSSLNPRMRIGEAISEPMLVHALASSKAEAKAKTISLLEDVGLEAVHFERFPHEFSGGQRQRICIARALALEPEFILCDESVSALDVSIQAQVLNLLNKLKSERGLTYIFISHDLNVVRYMSDRMLVMNKGLIEEAGLPEKIYSDPQSRYTRSLIESIPKIKYKIDA